MTYPNELGSAPPPADGLTDNVAGGIAYLTIIPAILFLFLAPYNRRSFVRFHCFQCLFLFLILFVSQVLHIFPILGSIVVLAIHLIVAILWLIAIIQAFAGKKFLIPIIGPLAEQAAGASA